MTFVRVSRRALVAVAAMLSMGAVPVTWAAPSTTPLNVSYDVAREMAKYAKQFPRINLFTVDEVFGGWTKTQKEHLDDGGTYDQVIAAAKTR